MRAPRERIPNWIAALLQHHSSCVSTGGAVREGGFGSNWLLGSQLLQCTPAWGAIWECRFGSDWLLGSFQLQSVSARGAVGERGLWSDGGIGSQAEIELLDLARSQ